MEAVKDPESSGPLDVQPQDTQTEQADLGFDQSGAEDIFIAEVVAEPPPESSDSAGLKAVIEAAIYVTDEPLTPEQIASATEQPIAVVNDILQQLVTEYAAPGRGLAVRELAGGYKMSTKPEYHESIRRFVKRLQPPLKLSLAALETLAVVAYKQPITGPEILEIRGVQGAGVLKTLLDRRLIATAGRKNVLGKPMMYKTTREFLIQFGLDSLAELPTLKEFEELGRLALTDEEVTTTPELPASGPEKRDAAPEDPTPVEASVADVNATQADETPAEEPSEASSAAEAIDGVHPDPHPARESPEPDA